MSQLACALGLGLALFLAASAGLAADTPASPAEAAKLFEAAMRDYDQGNLTAAIDELRAAQRAAPRPEVLYNLAQLLDAAGRRAEAHRTFEEYLTVASEKIDPARRRAIEAKLLVLKKQLVPVEVTCNPAGASIHIDGEPTVPPLLVEPGDHPIEVSAPGFAPETFMLQARHGESPQVFVRLAPEVKPPVSRPHRMASRRVPPTLAPPQVRPPRSWPPALLAAGATLTAGALVSHLLNSSRRDDWQAESTQLNAVPGPARDDAYWKARAQNSARARSIRYVDGIELGLLLGAGTFAGTGLTLWLTSRRDDTQSALGFLWSRRW